MSKKISIIVPCYMVEEYIDRCAASLLNQTIGLENLELIFINDASPDNTLAKLLDYEKQYPESIIIINSEENLRQGGARNLGLQIASADYIGFIDADDWVELTMFEKLYQKAITYDCDIVSCGSKRVFDESTPMGPTGYKDRFYIIDDATSRKDLLITGMGSGGGCARLYKKSLIHDNDIFFPEHLAYEDNFFGYLVEMYVKRIYLLEEDLYYYFINTESTTTTKGATHHFDRLTIELMKLEELKTRGLFEEYYEEHEYNFLLLFYLNTLHIIFTRFKSIPLDIVNTMRQEVLNNFPTYQSNPYTHKFLPEVYKILLDTIATPMDQETWNQLAEQYRSR
jgi:glycosyltransferase involved in cell wall biosynthesis